MKTKSTIAVLCLLLPLAGRASAQRDTVWTRTYGEARDDGFRDAVATADGGTSSLGEPGLSHALLPR